MEELWTILPSVLLEGLVTGSMLAMVALGYAMVYGVLGLINFAHSEIFMIGAVAGVEVFRYLGGTIANPFLLLMVALLVAALISGFVAVGMERFAYRPLRRHGPPNRLVPLITAIGLSFLLQDVVRLIEGLWHNEFYLNYPSHEELERSFDLTATTSIQMKSILVLVVCGWIFVGLYFLVLRTRLGRAIRAVAQDAEAAALMGISPNRIISRTFLIGGALGGVAGVLWGLLYTNVTPYMGFTPGVKAFTAAVLGGIGSMPGALLGGLVLGLFTALFGTYLPFLTDGIIGSEYTDVFVFILLVLLLVTRPQGLLGRKGGDKV